MSAGLPKSAAMLEGALAKSFVQGATWPVDRASLAALIDMGLSNSQIAAYFSVAPDDVYMLREHYRFD